MRVQVAGSRSFPRAFDAALRRELQKSSMGSLVGWTLLLDAEASQVTPFAEGSEAMQSCQLSVSARLDGPGNTFDLGPVGDRGAGTNTSSACDGAAIKVAERVARQIASHLAKEGSK